MKLTFKHILSAAAVSACVVTSQAQSTYSGYFLDNYMYSFEMNPAMVNMGKHGFVSMPAIGNLNIGMKGNLHVTDLLYNRDGKTVLFANPQVSAGEVLGNLSSANKIGIDTRIDIMSVGFKALGGQNVVSISAIADANVSAPKSIFSLIKEGISNRTYDIRDLRANATGKARSTPVSTRLSSSSARMLGRPALRLRSTPISRTHTTLSDTTTASTAIMSTVCMSAVSASMASVSVSTSALPTNGVTSTSLSLCLT